MSTCISRHGEFSEHTLDNSHTCTRCHVLDEDALREQLAAVEQDRDRLQAELTATRNNRLISAVFGHHKGAPRPFALYRTGEVRESGLVALGAEFPDGAVALRLANDGGWTTRSEGGAEGITGYATVVWLSDELESLAEMEQDRDLWRDRCDGQAWTDLEAKLAKVTGERDDALITIRALVGPAAEDTAAIQPCQPIGCDNGYHLAGCRFAEIDAAEEVSRG